MKTMTSLPSASLLNVELHGPTVVLTPAADLREFEYQRIEDEGQRVVQMLADGRVRNVVVDCSRTTYYGSTALSFFLRLWKQVCVHGGRMALCGVAPHEREILQVTRLDTVWPLLPNRRDALAFVDEAADQT